MKKISFIPALLIILSISNSLMAQGSWKLQTNPLGTGDSALLGRVQFVSAQEGWISVSQGARLLHTTNAGANWSVVILNAIDTVTSLADPALNMHFISPSTGWVLKSFGKDFQNTSGAVVYKTIDGGVNWQKIILSQNPTELGIQLHFMDANNGWASVFNFETNTFKIYSSTNGGLNWNVIFTGGALVFDFVNAMEGWAIDLYQEENPVPPFIIYRSANGGASGTPQFTDNTPGKFNALHFTDLNNGWVVGAGGKVLHTTNGGTNWSNVTNTGMTSEYNCNTLFFLHANAGWVGSSAFGNQYVYETKNGGANWNKQEVPVTAKIFSMSFWDVGNGWLTSDYGQIAHYDTIRIKDSIPNFGFENWVSDKEPSSWQVTGTTATKTTDRFSGNYALKLQTDMAVPFYEGYGTINSYLPNGAVGFEPSIPISERHTSLNGYFKFLPINGDSCQFYILMTKKGYVNPVYPDYGNILGVGHLCKTMSANYAPFTVPIYYFNDTLVPDNAYISLNAYKDFNFVTLLAEDPFGNSTLYVDQLSFDEFTVSIWKGMVSDAWENPANWSTGKVPSAFTDVIVNTGTTYTPVIHSNVSCQSLKLSPGVNVSVSTGFTLTITGK